MAGLIFIFVILPVTAILFFLWVFTKRKLFRNCLLAIWGAVIFLLVLVTILQPFFTKKVLDKSDFYGEYIIDRNYFSGKHADWQYNHFRFKITHSDSIYFYQTERTEILKTYRGTIRTTTPYKSARLIIDKEPPSHHILSTNPTIYREVWDFFLVFNSTHYYNMYFRKGKWNPIKH